MHYNVFKTQKIKNFYKLTILSSNLAQIQKRYNFYNNKIGTLERRSNKQLSYLRFFIKTKKEKIPLFYIKNTKRLLVQDKVLSLRLFISFYKGQIKKDNVFVRDMPLRKQYFSPQKMGQTVTEINKHKIIRPLLDLKRENITTVCKTFNLPVYPDKSNRSVQYSRNRIRKQIIPSIKRFLNPQVENSLFKTAELFNQEQNFLYSLLINTEINSNCSEQY